MRLDRYGAVDEILGRALDLSAEEREAFLAEACRERPETLFEVRRLLAADAASERFLESSPAAALGVEERWPPGTPLGPYRLVRLLGSGGMGVVYLAERGDGKFERPVAVKLLGRASWSEEGRARFRNESRILAGLEHPHIASLYDAGESEAAGSYLVMELVEGKPLDAYCDSRQLSLAARLRLFLKILGAVGYAHQNLLVHRDLKPANILVGEGGSGAGEPKLLDFGIAKQLDPHGSEDGEATRTSARPMTPSYASPEQVRREPVGTASDLYTLGVILYALLCGERPYRLATGLPHELEAAILEQEPLRPSEAAASGSEEDRKRRATARGTSPRQLARQLAGDLDAIVLKALAKDSRGRYGSAAELALDLERHLGGLPVGARRDRASYRAAKFLRRHWVASTLAATALVFVLGFLVIALQQGSRARSERDKARQALRFLVEVFAAADPRQSGGERVTARDLLALGAERLEELPPGQTEPRATLMDAIGDAELGLGRIDEAAPLLEGALRLRRASSAPKGEVAASLEHLANLRLRQGRGDEAVQAMRQAVALRRSRSGGSREDLAEALNLLGLALVESRGGSDSALLREMEALHREALALSERTEGKGSTSAAVAWFYLAQILRLQGDLAGAEEAHRHNLALQLAQRGPNHTEVAISRSALAFHLVEMGRLREAQDQLRAALATQQLRLPPGHPDLLTTLSELGAVRWAMGAEEEAEGLRRRALEGQLAITGERHPHAANMIYNLANSLQSQGKLAPARELHEKALTLRRQIFGDSSLPVTQSLGALAKLHASLGERKVAGRLADEALAMSRALLGPDHPEMAWPLRNSAIVLLAQDGASAAEPLLRQSLALLEKRRPAGHYQTARVRLYLGDCLLRLGRDEEAERQIQQGMASLREQFGEGDYRVAEARRLLAKLARKRAPAP